MKFPDMAGANGVPASLPRRADPRLALDQLRATCRSPARTIDALGEAVSELRCGVAALEAENAELRAEHERLSSGGRPGRAGASGRFDAGRAPTLIVRLPCDTGAPRAARIAVVDALRDRVAVDVRERAQLLVSELVSNSVRHAGACSEDAVIVRVGLSRTMLRLEVEDPGCGSVIAPRPPDLHGGGGFGLQLVQTLSRRWGFERGADGPTIVWALLSRTPQVASAASDDAAGAVRARPSLTVLIDRSAGTDMTPPAGGQP